jgi:hypothetical protein
MKRNLKGSLAIVGAAAALLLLLVLGLVYGRAAYTLLHRPFNDRTFDRSVWIGVAGVPLERNPRGPMTEDLRRRFLHEGMSRREVRALLGQPDNGPYPEATTAIEDHYFLGHWGEMSIDGDYLIIHYDKRRRLVSTEIYQH